jgi:hypothetical protein
MSTLSVSRQVRSKKEECEGEEKEEEVERCEDGRRGGGCLPSWNIIENLIISIVRNVYPDFWLGLNSFLAWWCSGMKGRGVDWHQSLSLVRPADSHYIEFSFSWVSE